MDYSAFEYFNNIHKSLQEKYALGSALHLLWRWNMQPIGDSSVEKMPLLAWALDQFSKGGAFGSNNLHGQLCVSFLQFLLSLPRLTHLFPFNSPQTCDSPNQPDVAAFRTHWQRLFGQLAASIAEDFTADIPFGAFVALVHSALFGDLDANSDSSIQVEYLQRANTLCNGVLHCTLPLLAVCCVHGALLENILRRLCDAGCALDEASPANGAIILVEQVENDVANVEEMHPENVNLIFSANGRSDVLISIQPMHLRRPEATPLSLLVARNDLHGVLLLFKLGVRVDQVI